MPQKSYPEIAQAMLQRMMHNQTWQSGQAFPSQSLQGTQVHLNLSMESYQGTLHDILQALYDEYAGKLHPVKAIRAVPAELGLQGHEEFTWLAPDGQQRHGNVYRAIQHYAQENVIGSPTALMWYACQ
jgi:hypothetical protein